MQPAQPLEVQNGPMLRATVIALVLALVALAAMGNRFAAATGPDHVAHQGLQVTEAPHPGENGETTITFSVPEKEPAGFEIPVIGSDDPAMATLGEEGDAGLQLPWWDEQVPQIAAATAPLTAAEAQDQFRLPKRGVWEAFSRRLTEALTSGSFERLVALEPEVQAALEALRAIPGHVEYADWLEERLQDIEVAQRAAERDRAIAEGSDAVPLYDVWLERMRDRPPPARARLFVPTLKPIFAEAQLPPALVWIAETESSFNPNARSPAGARGLYQLMPRTARELGLRLRPHDQRLDPIQNARTAARYLAQLQNQFREWPLVLAAYHSGPTRVSRLLHARSATTFAEIADALPAETQLYVPKVLATLAIREGVTPHVLATTFPGLALADQASLAAE